MDGVLPRAEWPNVPIALLHAEVARRQENGERPSCGSNKNTSAYNTGLHVVALFLILTLSTLACSFPIIVRRFPKLPVPNYSLFLSRHFGTGVLIATAFVHLLPTAYTSLTDPCLPRFWNKGYPAMAGFIAMVSVLSVVAIEMFFATKGAGHSHGGLDMELLRGEADGTYSGTPLRRAKRFRHGSLGQQSQDNDDNDDDHVLPMHEPHEESSETANKPLPTTPPYEDDSDLDLDELDPNADDALPLNGSAKTSNKYSDNGQPRRTRQVRQDSFASPVPSPGPHGGFSKEASEQRAVLQCLLLEAGILFHSVFIGMALSVSTGPAFVVLLIAISFHQTFEGLALGSRIAAIDSFSTSSPKPWLMSFMYGVTTPLGQAIGLAVHQLYDPASQFGLLTVGIVNSISSGLLLYAGLVQLLAEDFLSDQSYVELHGRRRLEACAAVVAGSMLMAFVGAFA
ncbi:zinc-regulated transporter 2 [Acrodontium crateriforme]|uniref:Zinc-regulated transporter 2 n=1 Tax=Acrodontium crateriforme TaxID=150365 RepID=A0AAQ3LZT7_9PEZI|nr:zinc-regulated transporter 2 [Acrodontium crateriforme]